MHATGRWFVAPPLAESAEGLGAGAPDAAVLDAPPTDPDAGALADHEASFSPAARSEPTQDAADRDDKGQFKPRHRAASQRADVDDVPTINAHTKRIKEAEAKLGADIVRQDGESERAFTLRRRAELLERQTATPAPAARREEPAPKPAPDQELAPKPAAAAPAEKFSYPAFTAAVEKDPALTYDQWEIDRLDAYAEWRDQKQTAAKAQADAEKRQADLKRDFDTKLSAWDTRRDAFVAKHPDRAPAVLAFLQRIDANTPIGAALLHSEAGIELADHLADNLSEAERIEKLNPFQQILELGKLETTLVASQRPPSTRTAAAPTGSAPALVRPPAPRPPNPVRTGSIAEPDTPPDADEQSLSSHEKFYGRKYR